MDGRVKINLLDLKLPNQTSGDFTPRWRCFNNHVYNYLATRLDSLHSLVTALSEKVAFLEGAEAATQSPHSHKKAAIAKKEPEFWFIQQRVKELGLEISANQRMKIEMWANESYKERHGQIPKKQPFRGTQASAYPTADLDLLDATIKGVVAQGHS